MSQTATEQQKDMRRRNWLILAGCVVLVLGVASATMWRIAVGSAAYVAEQPADG